MNGSATATETGSKGLPWWFYTFVLSYGGVGLLYWFHATIFGPGTPAQAPGPTDWLRDATLALPFVAGAVALGRHGQARSGGSVAVLFAAVIGVGALLHQTGAGSMTGMSHGSSAAAVDTGTLLQRMVLVLLLAGAYGLAVERAGAALTVWLAPLLANWAAHPRRASMAGMLTMMLVLTPVFVLGNTGRAVAETSFPDQVIHPKGTLLLVARQLQDGTMAYVAPEYGPQGVRPIIEMTEGETLNITLKNELKADVSLHVHGVLYNQASDGTRFNNSFATPDSEYQYQWRAAVGTAGYWHYHDHVLGDNEGTAGISGGLYGGLIVRKAGDLTPARTFVVVFHNFSVNGRLYPDTPTPTAYEGELVEFLVISYMDTLHTFHLHGHRWLTPARTANPDPLSPANAGSGREDNHNLAPGDSFGFLTIAGDGVGSGMWMYHCHLQSYSAGMMGFFNVLQKP